MNHIPNGARPAARATASGAEVGVMSNRPSRGAAIAGLGRTDLGKVYGRSARKLAAEAVRLAVADAGLTLADLDGLIVCPGIAGGALDPGLAQLLGLRDLRLLSVLNAWGASAGAAVELAALAIGGGSAATVACVFADTPLRPRTPAGATFGRAGAQPEWHGLAGLRAAAGHRSVNAEYALAARRHMLAYGTTSEQLGAVAVAQRAWAAGNPRAQFRAPITLADHQASRWIAEPLHLLDCCQESDGGVAVVVTSAQRARDLPHPPAVIAAAAQGSGPDQYVMTSYYRDELAALPEMRVVGDGLWRQSGIGPSDVDVAVLYDHFTPFVLLQLEELGFCGRGEAKDFIADGAL